MMGEARSSRAQRTESVRRQRGVASCVAGVECMLLLLGPTRQGAWASSKLAPLPCAGGRYHVQVVLGGRAAPKQLSVSENLLTLVDQSPPVALHHRRDGLGIKVWASWRARDVREAGVVAFRRLIARTDASCAVLVGRLTTARPQRVEPFVAWRETPAEHPRDPGTRSVSMRAALVASLQGGEAADKYEFASGIGDVVTLSLTRGASLVDGSSTLDPLIELRDSRGYLVAIDDDFGSATPAGPGRNALIQSVQLPATDTYTVIARGAGGTSGPYTIQLTSTAGANLVPATFNPVPPTVPAFTFDGEITIAGQNDLFTFAANAGTTLSLGVLRLANELDGTATLDPSLELRDSRGVLVKADDDGGTNDPVGPGRNALVANLHLLATDTYTIAVRGSGQTLGPYRVEVTFAPLPGGGR